MSGAPRSNHQKALSINFSLAFPRTLMWAKSYQEEDPTLINATYTINCCKLVGVEPRGLQDFIHVE